MNGLLRTLLTLLLLHLAGAGFSQYILNGSAQKNNCNCYTLTQAVQTQSGSVWNGTKINLNTSFDFWFNVNLGCADGGADGIVFILQPISTSVGSTGEGMGFAGVQPSVGIALDTYQNTNLNDPAFDHISIQTNGAIAHLSDLAGPVPISAISDNVEDCAWHQLRITWDAQQHWLRCYFDTVLRLQTQIDLVPTIFGNDPLVYWGFTGATGGQVNLQQFCTALDPVITVSAPSGISCADSAIQFGSASVSFTAISSYNWDFGDGTTSTLQQPPPHVYATAGRYPIKLKIKGQDGCENDTVITITIAGPASAMFTVADTCFGKVPTLLTPPYQAATSYEWFLDGPSVGAMPPPLTGLATGPHRLELAAVSNYNCGPPDFATTIFNIKPTPQVSFTAADACVADVVQFNATQLDAATTISGWQWAFGDGRTGSGVSARHAYSNKGLYNARLYAVATNGCASDTVYHPIKINAAEAFAGRDTAVVLNTSFQLAGTGNGSFLWSPGSGLSNSAVANPTVTLTQEVARYTLTVTTAEGCTATDDVVIKAFKGPTVYVPSGFTPNGDGRNDVLLPVYVGIKSLGHFAVYNRWGQVVFSTSDMSKGWRGDGATGTFVWLVSATDAAGKPLVLKGTVTVIR